MSDDPKSEFQSMLIKVRGAYVNRNPTAMMVFAASGMKSGMPIEAVAYALSAATDVRPEHVERLENWVREIRVKENGGGNS